MICLTMYIQILFSDSLSLFIQKEVETYLFAKACPPQLFLFLLVFLHGVNPGSVSGQWIMAEAAFLHGAS